MKIIRFIKSNLLGFIIGGLIFGSITGVIATNLTASDVQYTSNTTVEDALDKLNSASDKPAAYWFSETQYVIGNAPTTLYLNGSSTNHNVYIGSTSEKHYVCMAYNGHEVCLSQPYTQYGLEGHTLNSDYTSSQQTSAKNALLQVFNDAGINIDISYCDTYMYEARCNVGGMPCGVDKSGYVYCSDDVAREVCYVYVSGAARCE